MSQLVLLRATIVCTNAWQDKTELNGPLNLGGKSALNEQGSMGEVDDRGQQLCPCSLVVRYVDTWICGTTQLPLSLLAGSDECLSRSDNVRWTLVDFFVSIITGEWFRWFLASRLA
eukprot:scaffold386069_cov19-Prasinocladus_malaysianus.AAC.1